MKTDFFDCLTEDDMVKIAGLAQVSIRLGTLRSEMLNAGAPAVWVEEILKIQEILEESV